MNELKRMAVSDYNIGIWNVILENRFNMSYDSISDEFKCVICKMLIVDATLNSVCGCYYCHKCINTYINNEDKYCPGNKEYCNDQFVTMDRNVFRNENLNKKILKLDVKCPNQSCECSIKIVDMESHLRLCTKQPMNCPFVAIGCNTERTDKERIESHLHSDSLAHYELLVEIIQIHRNEINALKEDSENSKIKFSVLQEESRIDKEHFFMLNEDLRIKNNDMELSMWASILLGLMIVSFMCFCLSTHEYFRRPSLRPIDDANSSICTENNTKTNTKFKKDCTTETLNSLVMLDVVLNIIFTTEFFLKLLLAPYKAKFMKSSICIMDISILSAYWLYMGSFYFLYYNTTSIQSATALWTLNVLSMTQSLRILRIFKISKISRGLRVLMLTIKKSIPELVLLAFLLMNGMFLFSSLIYIAEYQQPESFPDIPKAFWWSIVTLTTVGYGDSYPKGGWGYLVGSMTAICGCILTGLAIPIIGNNFNTYYMYMKNQLKEDKYLKELHKDMNHVPTNLGKAKAHKAKFAHFGGQPPTAPETNTMFKRKFTTVDCPSFAGHLQGLNMNNITLQKSNSIGDVSAQIDLNADSEIIKIESNTTSTDLNNDKNSPFLDKCSKSYPKAESLGEINKAFIANAHITPEKMNHVIRREDYV